MVQNPTENRENNKQNRKKNNCAKFNRIENKQLQTNCHTYVRGCVCVLKKIRITSEQ